jgi:hypothetical protein
MKPIIVGLGVLLNGVTLQFGADILIDNPVYWIIMVTSLIIAVI